MEDQMNIIQEAILDLLAKIPEYYCEPCRDWCEADSSVSLEKILMSYCREQGVVLPRDIQCIAKLIDQATDYAMEFEAIANN